MSKNLVTRRDALRLMVIGAAATLATGCETLSSIPRGQPGGTTDGSELAFEVRKALKEHPSTGQFALDISSNDSGEVIIKGFVDSDADVANIDIIANGVDGVTFAVVDVYKKDF